MTQRIYSDDALVAIVQAWVAAGIRDDAGGGVSPVTLARVVDATHSGIAPRLRALADEGRLVRVEGIGPRTSRPRPSFLPAGHPDAPGERAARDAVAGSRGRGRGD